MACAHIEGITCDACRGPVANQAPEPAHLSGCPCPQCAYASHLDRVFAATDSALKRWVPSEADKYEALRDWFAGMAMQGLIPIWRGSHEDLPLDAYRFADAMLKARKLGAP